MRQPVLYEGGRGAYKAQGGKGVFKYFLFLSRWKFGATVLDYFLLPHSHFTSLTVYFSISFLYFPHSLLTLCSFLIGSH
jgi:hypothetical protein